jgi:hypothetical protein
LIIFGCTELTSRNKETRNEEMIRWLYVVSIYVYIVTQIIILHSENNEMPQLVSMKCYRNSREGVILQIMRIMNLHKSEKRYKKDLEKAEITETSFFPEILMCL